MSAAALLLMTMIGCRAEGPPPRTGGGPPAPEQAAGVAAAPAALTATSASVTRIEDRLVAVAPQDLYNVAAPPSADLTAQDLGRVIETAAAIGFHTGYYRNGCQSRAHALWAALPANIRAKVGKIWLFQPWIYAPILKRRAIRHPDDKEITWDFHVALRFKSNGVERVLDLALGKEPISPEQWLTSFDAPNKSLLIRTEGKYYSYNLTGGSLSDFYEYAGDACRQSWMIDDVAFDKVGAQLLARPEGCATLAAYSSNAVGAKNELQAATFAARHPGAGCAALKNLYFSERTRVLGLVDKWARPDGCLNLPP